MPIKTRSADALRNRLPPPKQAKGPPDLKRPEEEEGLPVPESAIQKAIIARLVARSFVVVRVNSGGFKDKHGTFVRGYTIAGLNAISGFPDLVAFKGEKCLLIEVKKPDGEVSDSQQRFHDFAAARGVTVHVLRAPEDLDAILKEMHGPSN